MRTTYASGIAAGVVTAGMLLAACGGPGNSGQDTTAPPSTTSQHSTSRTSSAPPGSISEQRAGTIATDKYGGDVLNVEADRAKGRPAWEVEVENSRKGRIEVDVAKDNGDILEMESDNG